ncbi:MAG TPA: class I SAM-dependent methyltransferase, partial [Candidatus Angelobacter sp.]|nr:class I SAM-dependent methyltransferase [Candidatus Angelobacter sp.]
ETEKQRLIQANELLVIDGTKSRLTHDDLTRQLQQLRLVLYQAPRYSTPTYYLDTHLSVIHWNVAFELIFKPILSKIRRRHVNHLIAELSNCREVFNHAREFTDNATNGPLPLVDLEPLIYNSNAYGVVEFEKVATQLTDADANLKAWAVALFIKNIDWDMYNPDLLRRLEEDKLWGIYAVSYDAVLSGFSLYRQLIDEVLLGIPAGSGNILELGAGTGNATQALLQRGYRVTAVENNPLMLERLSAKKPLQTERLSINGESIDDFDFAGDGPFDAVVAVNVVYALDDPSGCFRKVAHALKPNGVFALSTTYSETDVEPLLAALEAELRAKGTFRASEEHFRRVALINKQLEFKVARRYSRKQYEAWLEQAGFVLIYNTLSYKDAVVVIHARKVATSDSSF